jgi:MFS family permease
MKTSPERAARPAPGRSATLPLVAIIVGQVCLHACMAGVRVAAPLKALQAGHSAWDVGVLMALFAAGPIALALQAGRLADRHGYHRPLYLAVALCVAGGLAACVSQHYLALCLAALLCGAGANVGMITIQRSAGRLANDATERMRVFSWVGLAPALANVVGAIGAGLLIDHAGFRAAFAVLMLMPLPALAWSRFVEREAARSGAPAVPRRAAWDLLRSGPLRRLLLVNWLLSASWDMHGFVLPVLGHERGMSASAIGSILGLFAAAVAAVRLLVPVLAHRLRESQVLVGAMLCTALVLAVYPLVHAVWLMAACALLLGLALGSVQPMIMSSLHHITPLERHGEAIALRSMTINFASTVMPLLFGVAGAALGAGAMFWLMAASVGAGSLHARRI